VGVKTNFAVSALLVVGLLSCKGTGVNRPLESLLPLDSNTICFEIGDSWLYKTTEVGQGLSLFSTLKDTSVGLCYFEVTKDTIIDSLSMLIVVGKRYFWVRSSETIVVNEERYAVLQTRMALTVYRLPGDGEIPYSFAKTNGHKEWTGMSVHFQKRAFFASFVHSIVFPLTIHGEFVCKHSFGAHEGITISKEFLGTEGVSTECGVFESYKFRYHFPDGLGEDWVFFDWLALGGLMKSYRYLGKTTWVNSLGVTIADSIPTFQHQEFIGSQDANPDTLFVLNSVRERLD
jgi:hypothetical protein